MLLFNVEIPKPKSMLNKGDEKDPVRAISINPFFAIEVFAIKSPIELPHANTVRPSKVVGNPVSKPKSLRRSIIKFAKSHIQKTLIPNEIVNNNPNIPS
jgi:hypothetical protein